MAVSNVRWFVQNGYKYDLSTGTYVLALLDATRLPVQLTDSTWSDVSANEVATGGGYTQGGQVATVTWSVASAVVKIEIANLTWPSATFTYKYPVLIRRAGGSLAGTDPLMCFWDADDTSGASTVTGDGQNIVIGTDGDNALAITYSTT